MKRIALLLIAIAFASCKQEKPVAAGDMPYFLFDKVEYYHKDVSRQLIDSLYKSEKSRQDMGLLQIVTGTVPTSPRDTLFINNMSILKFDKKEIDVSKNAELSRIFSQKTVAETTSEPNCEPIYNDILIFRQKGQLVGVAKISFDCKKQQMVGIRYNPKDFGKAGEYEELRKLLGSL